MARPLRRIEESEFVLVANGHGDTPPVSGIAEYLNGHRAKRVTVVLHPLHRDHGTEHTVTEYRHGHEVGIRRIKLPNRPPATYPLDLLVPVRARSADCWIAFNSMHVLRALLTRRLGHASNVVYWAVDFVPNRFSSRWLTKIYDWADAAACRRSDFRVDLSHMALMARNGRHGLDDGNSAPALTVPIGVWVDRFPKVAPDGWSHRRIAFTGHLSAQQGVDVLVEALGVLHRRGVSFHADITGRGPLEDILRARVRELGLDDRVRFHGFLPSHRDVETLLAQCSVGVAPYAPSPDSFSNFADASKLKSYLAAGLPIVMTDVPPNAAELVDAAGAEIVHCTPDSVAAGIERCLADGERWVIRRNAAIDYARRFDWSVVLDAAFSRFGFDTES